MIDLENSEIIDISPAVSESTAVFPGDQSYKRNIALDFQSGDNLLLSSILTTLHIGAHADAPSHYNPKGDSIDQRSLRLYMGRCQVVEAVITENARVAELKQDVNCPRVLVKTDSFPNPDQWVDGFKSLEPELVDRLASQGVQLIGIDTPSVDPFDSRELPAHQSFFRNNLAVLEGLVLKSVEPGEYQLLALPLKLLGADASPVRCVLLRG